MQDHIEQWLAQTLHGMPFELVPLAGDASFRSYLRVLCNEQHLVLMIAPPEKEDHRPFLHISTLLGHTGLNVPQVLASNSKHGLILLTDLGDQLYLDCLNENTVEGLYADALCAIHKMQLIDASDLPPYDETLLRNELALFTDWLCDHHCGIGSGEELLRSLEPICCALVKSALAQPQVFVHRDYHSRNLMQMPGNNPGILDFQDALRGPASYDLVSLLKDCYIQWPLARSRSWAEYFRRASPHVNEISSAQWQVWFDWMGLQRHMKASGIFARLCHRDGKHAYLRHLPATLDHILQMENDYPQFAHLYQLTKEAKSICAQRN
ncbi:MAG: aminoglycoside phosphotransferase family protein [Candidatus Eutrophobiaceae bacterium]